MNEQQFILRLPQPLVEPMRFALSSNKKREGAGEHRKPSTFQIHFKDERNAVFTIDGKDYPASLLDLPCIVETHKTADKRTFYKSGDLHQVLVVRMPHEPAPKQTYLQNGITPATKRAAERLKPPKRFFTRDEVELIERRIKYVIDHKTSFTQKKTQENPTEEEEVVIEEETVNAQPGKNATDSAKTAAGADTSGAAASAGKPPLPSESPPLPSPMDVLPSPAVDTPGPYTPQPFTPQPFTPTPFTPIDTPGPDGEEDDDDDDEDDDDDDDAINADMADMVDQLMEDKEDIAKRRIERIKLDQSIKEQKAKIAELEAQAEKAPNPVLKKRFLSKRPELQAELTELEKQRQQLGDD
eukprot:TRINITY_DN273_c0_g1_i1.p1 TRINITY_DN273_c0_g1~~TRINITY_DN273_c0_g1_i1.p1  ORF type:complete len:355 (-),score=99.84 TRINITY_DN273_c0_g1_i1:1511-2575(-)